MYLRIDNIRINICGNCLTIQKFTEILNDIGRCGADNFPDNIVAAGRLPKGSRFALVVEVIDDRPRIKDVRFAEAVTVIPLTDFIKFMFFIGLLLNNNKWDKIQYISDFETITGNLHLFPKALELFFDVRQSLFLTPDDLALETGTKTLLQVFGVVVNNKKQQNGSGYQMAATKLVIMFPRVIHTIQFGWIEEVFPNYSYDNFNIKKMKEQEDKKDKKNKENKERSKKVERSSSTRKSTKK